MTGRYRADDCRVGEVLFGLKPNESKTVNTACTGNYLTLKPASYNKLSLCRVRVYGTCSSKNIYFSHVKEISENASISLIHKWFMCEGRCFFIARVCVCVCVCACVCVCVCIHVS